MCQTWGARLGRAPRRDTTREMTARANRASSLPEEGGFRSSSVGIAEGNFLCVCVCVCVCVCAVTGCQSWATAHPDNSIHEHPPIRRAGYRFSEQLPPAQACAIMTHQELALWY